jgi:hypothetical protein
MSIYEAPQSIGLSAREIRDLGHQIDYVVLSCPDQRAIGAAVRPCAITFTDSRRCSDQGAQVDQFVRHRFSGFPLAPGEIQLLDTFGRLSERK